MKRWASLPLAAVLAMACAPAAQAAWTRSYVVSGYEPAIYYGGASNPLGPGSDCPKGANTDIDWVQVLVDAGYTPAQAKWLRDPANPTREPNRGQNQMAFRGKNRENVYIHPTTTPEVGFPMVEGRIAEGFDLDGDPNTGFTSPTGRKGVDNNYYKVFGCWKDHRERPWRSTQAVAISNVMINGAWTMLLVLSGRGADPRNDKDVTLGIYDSQDVVAPNGSNEVISDYSFRVQPNRKLEGLMKARTVNGRVITEVTPEINIHAARAGLGASDNTTPLLRARAELTMTPDGGLEGLFGGYVPWQPIYECFVGQRGPVWEMLNWIRLPDVYYALKRYADYSPAGPGGEKTHISYGLRIAAKPAFVMTPDGATQVTKIVSFKDLPPGPVRPGLVIARRLVDGLSLRPGEQPVSLPEELLSPPKDRLTALQRPAAAETRN